MKDDITITVDADEINRALDQLESKEIKKVMQAGTRAAGKFLRPKLKAASPVGKTKNMRNKVSAKTKKSRKDAGSYYTVVTTFSRHRHLVIDGTQDRWTKAGRFTGRVTPNPWITPVADQYGEQARELAIREIARKLNLE